MLTPAKQCIGLPAAEVMGETEEKPQTEEPDGYQQETLAENPNACNHGA